MCHCLVSVSTEQTFVVKYFRNFILICPINFTVDIILSWKKKFKECHIFSKFWEKYLSILDTKPKYLLK